MVKRVFVSACAPDDMKWHGKALALVALVFCMGCSVMTDAPARKIREIIQ